MKAILRSAAGLFGLLLASSVSYGYVWCTPVLKMPYPQAPDTYNSGFYLMDAWGRLTGPHYYLVPPGMPFNGILPGPTGHAINSGNLPHHILMSKNGMSNGNAPMLGKQQGPMTQQQPYGPMQQFQPYGPMQQFQPFQPMQGPRMDMPPHQPHVGGATYPTHPFTRSPRDFFMWGENLDDERARGNRPYPVP